MSDQISMDLEPKIRGDGEMQKSVHFWRGQNEVKVHLKTVAVYLLPMLRRSLVP